MTSLKIVIIGAGSKAFGLGFVQDICLTEGVLGSRISMVGRGNERLDMIHNIACRYATELKVDLKFEKTTDRRAALQDADFVINAAAPTNTERQKDIHELALKHGFRRDRFGGLVDTFYQLDLCMEIVKDIGELCPDAWYIQLANPVFANTTLITRESKVKTIGFCNGPITGITRMCEVLGLDRRHVTWEAAGINHCVWLTDFRHKGQEVYPLLNEWVKKKAETFWNSPQSFLSEEMGPVAVRLYEMFGLFPIGDTWRTFRWFHTDRKTEKRWREDPREWGKRYRSPIEENMKLTRQLFEDPSASVTKKIPPMRTTDLRRRYIDILPNETVNIIDAIANDKAGEYHVNIPNFGCIPNIPNNVAVEVPAYITGQGVRGKMVDDLPKPIMILIIGRVLAMEREVEAYITGNKDLLIQILLEYPEVKSLAQATTYIEDLLALPSNQTMAEHFR